jgi:hypothetical protein
MVGAEVGAWVGASVAAGAGWVGVDTVEGVQAASIIVMTISAPMIMVVLGRVLFFTVNLL